MRFFVGIHHPSKARHFERCCISVNVLRQRKSGFEVRDWLLDSGAFTQIARFGEFQETVEEYAEQVNRWSMEGNLLAAVSQDYMCEPFIVERTGLSVVEHQELTIERYDALVRRCPVVTIMPVLQGYSPVDYRRHVAMYGKRLKTGAWVGIGSVCKRNGSIGPMLDVVRSVKDLRPDLRLHGFGVKLTSLAEGELRDAFYSCDSMAWSYHARKNGRNANCWREAKAFAERVETMPVQESLAV